jgi:uncharacterized protein YndB with AHSA1/START domain
MIHIEESIVIHLPIEDVFAYVCDSRNLPQWQTGLLEARQTTDSPAGVGTRLTYVRIFLGRKMESTCEVVEYELPTKYAYKTTSGPFPVQGSFLFESTAEGTKLTGAFEMQAGGFFALAEPLVARSIRRGVEGDLGNLKDLLESRTAGVSS